MNEAIIVEVLKADVTSVILLVLVLIVLAVLGGLSVFGVVTWRLLSVSSSVVRSNAGMIDNLSRQTSHLTTQTEHLRKQTEQLEAVTEAVNDSRAVLVAQMVAQGEKQATYQQDLLGAMASNKREILDEFKPVAEKLSAIGLGVDALSKAILDHRQSEMKVLTVLQEEQKKLSDTLITAEETLINIFNRVMEDDAPKEPESFIKGK